MKRFISEDDIERACIEVCTDNLGYKTFNCMNQDYLNRKSEREVLYEYRIKRCLKKINAHLTDRKEGLSDDEIDEAYSKLANLDYSTDPKKLNREVMNMIRTGVEVKIKKKGGKTQKETLQFIDWEHPESDKNDFMVVNQLWIQGDVYRLRPDVVVYVNGIPLVTIELKDSNVNVKEAYDDNLTRYKKAIPQLFAYNAFLVASNGIHTKVGPTYASWNFFKPWLRQEDGQHLSKEFKSQVEETGRSLDYLLLGLLDKKKLLDYVQNFIMYHKGNKICAQNHQFLGVNNAIERFKYVMSPEVKEEDKGKMGVFWHTQGSGKSFSMVFLARKIVRQFSGNFTFLVVTDREDLDDQIYGNFLHCGFISESDDCRPKDSAKLREMLGQNKKILFTLIQKFRYDKGKEYPLLSDRSDIIVFIDEAHRTQYKSLAENLRIGLPNAQFMAFTGTPLFGSKKLTNQWFGKTVSEYNFLQAVEDEATVRMTYSNHLPEVQNQNPTFSDDFAEIVANDLHTDAEREKLENEFATQFEILKRPSRLESIAKDIVKHFPYRGYLGKGIVACVDKYSAVRMYDFVKRAWDDEIKDINKRLSAMQQGTKEYTELLTIRKWMQETDMAVVVSEEAGEEKKFKEEGLDIKPHRERMNAVNEEGQTLEDLFKAEDSTLRLVMVCSMWLTGFDAPTVSTLYLDKPSIGHTLMQTIARANRTTDCLDIFGRAKEFGKIVSYCNVFGNLKKALAIYGDDGADMDEGGEQPEGEINAAMTPDELYTTLRQTIDECVAWCTDYDVDLDSILKKKSVFSKIDEFWRYADILLNPTDRRAQFNVYDNTISALYDELLPEIIQRKSEFAMAEVIHYLRQVMDNNIDNGNMDMARLKTTRLLDISIVPLERIDMAAEEAPMDVEKRADLYPIKIYREYDLTLLDYNKMREEFKQCPHKNMEIRDLSEFIGHKLELMLSQNGERRSFAERFQDIINRYNSSSDGAEQAFEELSDLIRRMTEEQQRASREDLSEEELEMFDILKKDKMTKEEAIQVKNGARTLLAKMKEKKTELFPQFWYKDSSLQQKVFIFIGDELDILLPSSYDRLLFTEKKERMCQRILQRASENRMFV